MALEFDGAKYVRVNSDLGITGGAITMSCWIKLNTEITEISADPYYILQQSDSGTKVKYAIYYGYNSGTRKIVFFRTKNYIVENSVSYNIALGTANWHHLVLVYDETNVYGFIDLNKTSTVASSGNGKTNGVDVVMIKAYLDDFGVAFTNALDAMMADVRIYNRALTANEIAEIYHRRGADRVWQGLVGWWRLDEAPSGTLAEHTDVAPHNMTSNNSPSPYVASTSSEYYYGHEAYMAFDGTNSVWGSTGTSGWLKLDYGSGNAPVLIGYAIKSYENSSFQTVMPKNWTFKGSNNDTDWTTLDTRTSITGWTASAWKEFWFSNSTGYRYYMIDITANNGYSYATYIAEMKHFTSQYNIVDLSGNGNHGTPYYSPVCQASPHRLRRGVLVS